MSSEATYISEDGTLSCSLTHTPLDVAQVTDWVGSDEAGALGLFIGTTRNSFQGKKVKRLEYEAYSKLAMRTMIEILKEARTMTASLPHQTPSHAPLASSCQRSTHVKGKIRTNGSPVLTELINGASHHHANDPGHEDIAPSPTPSPSSLIKLAIHHRLGSVPVGQPSIIIAVSSPHRKEAFVACEWILEEAKKRVQVWKKEVYDTPLRRDVDGVEMEESEWKANAIHPNPGPQR